MLDLVYWGVQLQSRKRPKLIGQIALFNFLSYIEVKITTFYNYAQNLFISIQKIMILWGNPMKIIIRCNFLWSRLLRKPSKKVNISLLSWYKEECGVLRLQLVIVFHFKNQDVQRVQKIDSSIYFVKKCALGDKIYWFTLKRPQKCSNILGLNSTGLQAYSNIVINNRSCSY